MDDHTGPICPLMSRFSLTQQGCHYFKIMILYTRLIIVPKDALVCHVLVDELPQVTIILWKKSTSMLLSLILDGIRRLSDDSITAYFHNIILIGFRIRPPGVAISHETAATANWTLFKHAFQSNFESHFLVHWSESLRWCLRWSSIFE